MPPLSNPKHEIVAQQMAVGKTATEALIFAGYDGVYSAQNSHRVTKRDEVVARIAELQQGMAAAQLVDANELHRQWSEASRADVADILDDRGRFKPIKQWPKIWRQMLSGIDVKELFERSKDGGKASWDQIGEIVKIKFIAMKDLGELLGRHKAVNAFVEAKQENHLHLHVEVEERLTKARQIAAQVVEAVEVK